MIKGYISKTVWVCLLLDKTPAFSLLSSSTPEEASSRCVSMCVPIVHWGQEPPLLGDSVLLAFSLTAGVFLNPVLVLCQPENFLVSFISVLLLFFPHLKNFC